RARDIRVLRGSWANEPLVPRLLRRPHICQLRPSDSSSMAYAIHVRPSTVDHLMNSAPSTLTNDPERIRRAGRNVRAVLAQEMDELGADATAFASQAVSMSGLDWLKQWLQPEIPPPPPIAVLDVELASACDQFSCASCA